MTKEEKYVAVANKIKEEVAKESERKEQASKSKQDKWNDFNFVLSLNSTRSITNCFNR